MVNKWFPQMEYNWFIYDATLDISYDYSSSNTQHSNPKQNGKQDILSLLFEYQ